MHRLITATSLAAALVPSSAWACGGFFCDSLNRPIDQSEESIIFSVDEDADTTEVSVQIGYEGTAQEFAWVLPTPAEPVVEITLDRIFNVLENRLRPRFDVTYTTEGECKQDTGFTNDTFASADDAGGSSNGGAGAPGGGGVTVIAQGPIGPYQQAVLQATDSDLLLTWLQDRGYTLPDSLAPRLDPYVASGSYFVALRLQSDKTAGDLKPVRVTYGGTTPSIPIQLTGIAATPDMRIVPFVFGRARAVPESYLHVEINPFAIDWRSNGANYEDVVSRAANQAGGQAFATDAAGRTSLVEDIWWRPGQYDLSDLDGQQGTFGASAISIMLQAGIPVDEDTQPFLEQAIPLPDDIEQTTGFDPLTVYTCLNCFPATQGLEADGPLLKQLLEENWVREMRRAEETYVDGQEWVTRLTSSMDAVEMTVDPTFTFNADMGTVNPVRTATVTTECGDRAYFAYEAPRRLELEDGRFVRLTAEQWAGYGDLIADSDLGIAAETIERTKSQGDPEPIASQRDTIDAAVAALSQATDDRVDAPSLDIDPPTPGATADCDGCASTSGSGSLGLVLLGLLAGIRRRR